MSKQYRAKITRERGSEDMDLLDKQKVKNIIRELYPDHSVYLNYFLWHSKSENKIKFSDHLKECDVKDCEYLSRPDVLCWARWQDHKLSKPYVIEIDGDVHRGDHKRQVRYFALEVPLIVINKADLKEIAMSWQEFIISEMERLKINKQG